MSWTGRPGPYQGWDDGDQDPEATVLLPIVPFDGPIGADLTMLLPVVGSVHDRPGSRPDRADPADRPDRDIRDEPWVPSGHDSGRDRTPGHSPAAPGHSPAAPGHSPTAPGHGPAAPAGSHGYGTPPGPGGADRGGPRLPEGGTPRVPGGAADQTVPYGAATVPFTATAPVVPPQSAGPVGPAGPTVPIGPGGPGGPGKPVDTAAPTMPIGPGAPVVPPGGVVPPAGPTVPMRPGGGPAWPGGPGMPPASADPTVAFMPPNAAETTIVFGPVTEVEAAAGVEAAAIEAAGERITEATGEQPSVVRSSAIMAVGSLVSRITGLLRTVVLGAAIGASAIGNGYNLSNSLPNMVYDLLLGGVLTSVMVPALMQARTRDPDKGEAYAQRLLTLAVLFLTGATVLAVALAPLLTQLLASGNAVADQHLITTLNYLILPEIFFYGLAALIAAVLNTRGHFAAPMWSPILNNIVVIGTAAVFILLPGPKGNVLNPESITTTQVLVLGIGTTLGIVAQAAGLFPALRRVRFRWKWRFDFKPLQLPHLARISAWMLCYVIISEVALTIVLRLSQAISVQKLDNGANAPGPAIFNNAYLIFMMAHGIVAVSIMTALMPRMSKAAAEGRFPDLARLFSQGVRLVAVVLVPATAAYVVLGGPLAITLFQFGAYTHDEAMRTGTVIAMAGIGLVPYAITQMQLFAFYAMPDTRTPAMINLPTAALRVGADLVFFFVLPAALVDAGLMVGNTLSYMLAASFGYYLLRRRVGRLDLGQTSRALGKLVAAAAIAAVPAWLVARLIGHVMGDGKFASGVALAAGGIVLIAGYFAAAIALRARDVTEVVGLVRGRFGR